MLGVLILPVFLLFSDRVLEMFTSKICGLMKNKCYIRNYLMCLDLYHIYNTVNKHPEGINTVVYSFKRSQLQRILKTRVKRFSPNKDHTMRDIYISHRICLSHMYNNVRNYFL